MLIEGAFFKLLEVLIDNLSPDTQYEGMAVNILSLAILSELNYRNIAKPLTKIQAEKPYELPKSSKKRYRSDLFVNVEGLVMGGVTQTTLSQLYEIKSDNWIECKYFHESKRKRGCPKVAGSGKIAGDIIRLCLFPSLSRENGRYLFTLFSASPDQCIAFGRKDSSQKREWLKKLYFENEADEWIELDFKEENQSFCDEIDKNFHHLRNDFKLSIRVTTLKICPKLDQNYKGCPNTLYWLYLFRIDDFKVTLKDKTWPYEGWGVKPLNESDFEKFDSLRGEYLELLK
ncbi:MAG: hypothetical protein AB9903_34250 [Vulcanimicrobiota bacterium]